MIDFVDAETQRLPIALCWSLWIALSAALWVALAALATIVAR